LFTVNVVIAKEIRDLQCLSAVSRVLAGMESSWIRLRVVSK